MLAAPVDRAFLPREEFQSSELRKQAEHWTQVLRSQAVDDFFKEAKPGQSGDEEVAFEQAMSNLAHSYLRNRAPGLQDYELGFQLLERGKDNERATGVFGFKVGEQLLLAPRFFREGELKGNELLYLKESDTFVPMTEEWVNYLLGRKPVVLGQGVPPNDNPLGIGRPDLRPLWQSPLKYSSDSSDWASESVDDLAGAAVVLGEAQTNYTLNLVKESSEAAAIFVSMLDAYPHLIAPYVEILGADVIKAALDSAALFDTIMPNKPEPRARTFVTGSIFQEQEKAAAAPPSKLEIIYRGETAPPGLTEKEASQLLLDGFLIRDGREKHAEAYAEQFEQKLQNPARTGVYEVLVKPGSFKSCLVVYRPKASGWSDDTGVIVVDLSDKSWTAAKAEEVYVDGDSESESEFKGWFEKRKSADPDSSGTFIAIGPDGASLGPFSFRKSLPSKEGGKCFEFSWQSGHGQYSYNVSRQGTSTGRKDDTHTISFGEIRGSRLVRQSGIYYIPEKWKLVRLDEPVDDHACGPGDSVRSEKQPPLRLGNMADVELNIYEKTSSLAVWSDGLEAVINNRRSATKAGFLSLVRDYGFAEKDAAAILKQAELKRGLKLRVKSADLSQVSNSLNDYGPVPFPSYQGSIDSTMGSQYPSFPEQVDKMTMMNMQPQSTRRLEPPGPDVLGPINQAIQTGQRDILDVGTMGSLLKTTRDENLVDKQIGHLVKGMDGLGRLIFNMYQNPEVFEERYGKDDIPEMEDKMLSSFEDMGDIVLQLRQRSIDPMPGINMGDDTNLSTRG